MTLEQWVVLAASGAMFGLIGQLIRTTMGLRKLHRSVGDAAADFQTSLNLPQLVISLFLGALAGLMASISMLSIPGNTDTIAFKDGGNISAAFISAIVAAGYAGGDFLEGIMKKHDKPRG
ncbi:MAG: hypothetical protein ABJM43_20385 [Paracoccaceae bacterium]